MKVIAPVVLLAVLIAASAFAAPTTKIQCWNDKNGNRMCGDRVPPEYAGQQREVIQDGRIVETKRGAKTAEEIAEEERQKVEAEEAKRRAEYDRSLLESYRNLADIENMRDERLNMLDSRIRAAEKSGVENQKTLDDLHARRLAAEQGSAAASPAEQKPADIKLAKQIRQYERALEGNKKSLERLIGERSKTQEKFASDAKRYSELRPPAPPKKTGN